MSGTGLQTARPSPSDAASPRKAGVFMQRILDKWGLPFLAVVIGAIILWGLFFSPGRVEDAPKGPVAGAPTAK